MLLFDYANVNDFGLIRLERNEWMRKLLESFASDRRARTSRNLWRYFFLSLSLLFSSFYCINVGYFCSFFSARSSVAISLTNRTDNCDWRWRKLSATDSNQTYQTIEVNETPIESGKDWLGTWNITHSDISHGFSFSSSRHCHHRHRHRRRRSRSCPSK